MDIRYASGDYNLVDDPALALDQTAGLQAFINAGSGKAILPPWRIAFTQLKVTPGLDLEGSGIGPQWDGQRGTYLKQLPGSNKDAIINDPAKAGPGAWMHWTRLSNFRLEGTLTDTAGSGIKYSTSPGEGCIIDRVFVKGFPEHGIWMADGAVPLKLRDLHLFQNGQYGLKIGNSTVKLFSSCHIDTISGDENGLGLVHLQKIQKTTSNVSIIQLKSEAAIKQDWTVHIEDCNCPIKIDSPSVQGTLPHANPKALVRISGPMTPRLSLYNVTGNWIDHLIDDTVNAIQLPMAHKIAVFYKDGLVSSWG